MNLHIVHFFDYQRYSNSSRFLLIPFDSKVQAALFFFVSRSQWIGSERSLNVFHLPINWLHTNENPVRSSFLISNVLCAEDIVPSESCEETSDLVSKAHFFYKYDWLNWLRFESWVSWDNIHCCMTFWHNKANSHNDNGFHLK